MSFQVYLPDKSVKVLNDGATVSDLAAAIGEGLARAALAGVVNGKASDMSYRLKDGDEVRILTAKDPEGLSILRHSTAHIMAEAIQELFAGTELGIGPATDSGFYYDVKSPHQLSAEDFDAITQKMREIIKQDEPFVREVVTREEAYDLFKDAPFKLELLNDLSESEDIVIYRHGRHVELCSGPHVSSSGKISADAFKLASVAGAYWRADAQNEMLQRVYANEFATKKELKNYLELKEEAKKRDHRVLGPRLGLFEFDDMIGPGLPLFLPKGAIVVNTMKDWLRSELVRRHYEEVLTPHIFRSDVWKTSGHYDFYHENMYFFEVNESAEGKDSSDTTHVQEFGVKPMNCPAHVIIYRSQIRSYRDLPLRLFEFGTVYRHELSGAVHGLFRARGFTQDDAHIFCAEQQVKDEVVSILDLVDHIMDTFDLTYSAEVSTRPEHSIGSDAMWEKAETFLREALIARNIDFEINEGDGAFYGPKIDIKVQDSLGRTWQCSTIQVDFNMPERFDITYRTADNNVARPWMLHRAIFGSIERFLGIIIEHFGGALPVWLAPIQASIIPIADRHLDYARQVESMLISAGIRTELVAQNESMRAKIAKAQEQKIPYMLIVGDKEEESSTVSLRERLEGDKGTVTLDAFITLIKDAMPKDPLANNA